MKTLVYLLTNRVTGKQYVGITVRTLHRRWYEHMWAADHGRKGSRLHDAIRKYGKEVFAQEVLHAGVSVFDAKILEVKEVSARGSLIPNGYNISPGGDSGPLGNKNRLGKSHSAETRRKLSLAHKGRKQTPEWVKAVSVALTGRNLSGDHCKNISEALKGSKNPAFGKERSADVRKRIGDFFRGRKRPAHEAIAMSERTRGDGHPQAKLNEAAVIHIRQERGNLSVARRHAERFGVCESAIYAVWSGRNWPHVVAPIAGHVAR